MSNDIVNKINFMLTEKEKILKEKLIIYKENNWNIPENINVFDLVNEMMENIGSLDQILRDRLIYTGLFNIIKLNNELSPEQCKVLTYKCLNDNYLFDGIDEISDKVFKRCFVVLLFELVFQITMKNNLLDKEEFRHIYSEGMRYIRIEKDFRGYDVDKGWAHTVAHSAGVLDVFAKSEFVGKKELLEILFEIKRRATINSYAYIDEEEESQINVVETIYKRKILTDSEFIKWIKDFDNYSREDNPPFSNTEQINRKTFLRSLYFRFLNGNYNVKLLDTVKNVLDNFDKYY